MIGRRDMPILNQIEEFFRREKIPISAKDPGSIYNQKKPIRVLQEIRPLSVDDREAVDQNSGPERSTWRPLIVEFRQANKYSI